MAELHARAVRVCPTRCPLPPPEQRVHSLPCRIHHDGPAPVKTYFRPESGAAATNRTDHGASGSSSEEAASEAAVDKDRLRAEFRGIQLQGEKLALTSLGFSGLVLEDSGMTHPDDEGRVWEVDNHFEELTWWDVPNHTTSETQQLPIVLQQWRDLATAVHGD